MNRLRDEIKYSLQSGRKASTCTMPGGDTVPNCMHELGDRESLQRIERPQQARKNFHRRLERRKIPWAHVTSISGTQAWQGDSDFHWDPFCMVHTLDDRRAVLR